MAEVPRGVRDKVMVSNGYEIAKNFITEMLSTSIIHVGAVEALLEVVILIYEVEPKETKEEGVDVKYQGAKGTTPSIHSRVVFSTDGETYSKEIPSPAKLDKGKAVIVTPKVTKEKDADLDEEYFEEGDDEMVSTISIIPTEYLEEYVGNPCEDYDVFSFIRYEDEPSYFHRPTEKQKSHLRPLHITASMSGIKVNKILIDGGVAINLLLERMLMKVGKHPDDLILTNISITDYS
ncbi:hypothetical protein Ahy_B05g079475 [Arachis hypogaea]|uniref:Uncharacterized protein n=1 Tax=Arachis hypogaea TaxID=3818 RepID=A0A444ZA01_ARAHY|nr:hypothetical protein Ahy_B05g079475 [Arachis hypogaea]